jgi:tetratricopeptide (TPR) repeat protein
MTGFHSHEFAAARDQALELIKLAPDQIYSYQVLGDSLLELGEYEKATSIFKKMEKLQDDSLNGKLTLSIRIARIEKLNGNIAKSETALLESLNIALSMKNPSRELIAWSNAQVAEHYFSTGNYKNAENYYEQALKIFPDYFLAVAGLGQVKAAQGELNEAIKLYKKVVELIPDLTFVATLGDLYKLAGKEKEAQQQYDLVEQIAKLSTLNGVLYNRSLALFYANHNIKAEDAYSQAEKEYQIRKDIYGADTLAWTALKAGKLTEAQNAIKEALKLGTKDAKFFYHAAMIAQASNDNKTAQDYLQRALTLNPQFEPLQSLQAKKILAELGS